MVKGSTLRMDFLPFSAPRSSFLIGRYLARDWVTKKIEGHEGFKRIDEAIAEEGWKIVGLHEALSDLPFQSVELRAWPDEGLLPGLLSCLLPGDAAGGRSSTSTSAPWPGTLPF